MGSEEKERELRTMVRDLRVALASAREGERQLQEKLESREAEIRQLRQMLGNTKQERDDLRQMLVNTKQERDELRQQNAELVNRLAIVGRKQSTSSPPKQLRSSQSFSSPPSTPASTTDSPVLQRRNSSKTNTPLPPLPPPSPEDTPPDSSSTAVKDDGSDTEYSDMESESGEPVKSETEQVHQRQEKGSESGDREKQPQKFSKPKPIIRSISSTSTGGVAVGRLASPKKSVAFPPSQNLSIISEEMQGERGSPEEQRQAALDKARGSPAAALPLFTGVTAENDEQEIAPRRRVTMSVSDFKKKSLSQDIPSDKEEGDEIDGEKSKMDHDMRRSRTCTISSSSGGSYKKEYKRKSSKQLKEAAARLERNHNFVPGGRKFQRLELLSPDMELRIREKICSEIGKKYGGLLRANRAAIVIQSAYRQYKLHQQYKKIRKEAHQVRKRAQSMKDPRRNPSMIRRNRPPRYNRNISALAPSNDPLLKAKLLSQDIGREGLSHMSSRRELVEKARSERCLVTEAAAKEKEEKEALEAENGVVEMETVLCEISMEEEATSTTSQLTAAITPSSSACEATDSIGIPTSFSSDILLTSDGYQRPLSIFSVRPAVSMMDTTATEQEGVRGAQTLPRRNLTPDVRLRKLNMGIGYFNRKPTKGIQYLVRESVLPDSPPEVATFLAKQYGLSKEKIGEFVGEICSEFHMAVLECLLEQMDMKNKPVDQALRDFQTLFRMPGEAQKIDKIMQMFALEYFRFNKDGVIKSEDAAYILSFAIMMLHTSLHNPSVKNRTTKKQWVSMNRGCNDGENFPEPFLHEIYERISKREFITGQDHTNAVSEIERNLIGYQNSARLAIPQRRLICRAGVTEIDHLTSRPSFKNKRRRILFVFSDQVIICKKRGGEQLEYRNSFSLMNAIAISFETHHYKNGIQLYSSHEDKAMFQCNCESSGERVKLLRTLETTISELRELEKERIAELGSSVAASQPQEGEGESRRRLASRAGDLLSSAQLDKPGSVRRRRESKGDYVSGVGDLVISSSVTISTTIRRRTSRSSGSSSPQNRTSGESGYDSQRTTPIPSPSPTNPPHTPHNSHSSSYTKAALQSRQSTASAPMTLVTPANPVKRSKSTDQIHMVRVMTITPTLSRETKANFSSVEDLRGGSSSASASPRSSKRKKEKENSRKSGKKLIFSSPFRRGGGANRRGSGPNSGSNSPVIGRSRAASETPSPPPSDLDLSTRSLRAASYLVNTT